MAAMTADAQMCATTTYSRRRPELTPCYKIIQDQLSTFIAARELENRPLPKYIIQEFEAYLKCGIPAFGFFRLRCDGCKEEKVVAYSSKKRGFCPSCCGSYLDRKSISFAGAAYLR